MREKVRAPTQRPSTRSIGLLGLSLASFLVVRWALHPMLVDMAVYRAEGNAVRHGIDLYGHLDTPFGLVATYPPFAAILFVPAAATTWSMVQFLAVAINLVLLGVVSYQSCRFAGVATERMATTATFVAAVAIWAEPVFTTLRNGQINLVLLALILWDFLRPADSRWRGIGIGLAAGIKVTPALFVVYLVLTRRYRMAATAVATFAATIAAAAAVVPSATWQFWTRYLFDTGRVGRLDEPANQSVEGVLARLTHAVAVGRGATVLAALVMIAALIAAVFAYRRLGDAWGVPMCAVAALLGAPIAWTHHWVWCVPCAVLLWTQARHWIPIVAVFPTFAVRFLPHGRDLELHESGWQVARSGWYVLFGVIFLALGVASARRRPGRPARPARPARPSTAGDR